MNRNMNKKYMDVAGRYLCWHCQLPVSGKASIQYRVEEETVEDTHIFHETCVKGNEAARRGLTYKCPKCDGSGKEASNALKLWFKEDETIKLVTAGAIERNPSRYETGRFEELPNFSKPCELCDGEGYLAKEPIPVVVEWRKAP